jgi:hypothetical protein
LSLLFLIIVFQVVVHFSHSLFLKEFEKFKIIAFKIVSLFHLLFFHALLPPSMKTVLKTVLHFWISLFKKEDENSLMCISKDLSSTISRFINLIVKRSLNWILPSNHFVWSVFAFLAFNWNLLWSIIVDTFFVKNADFSFFLHFNVLFVSRINSSNYNFRINHPSYFNHFRDLKCEKMTERGRNNEV